MRLTVAFTSQPSSRNCTASQSSSSGWLGGSPWAPKSSAVFTKPVPKNCCQNRFTATRAVSGCSGLTSQRARPRRLGAASAGSGGRKAGVARVVDGLGPLGGRGAGLALQLVGPPPRALQRREPLRRRDPHDRHVLGGVAVERLAVDAVEEREQPVVVLLADRVVLVVVAA